MSTAIGQLIGHVQAAPARVIEHMSDVVLGLNDASKSLNSARELLNELHAEGKAPTAMMGTELLRGIADDIQQTRAGWVSLGKPPAVHRVELNRSSNIVRSFADRLDAMAASRTPITALMPWTLDAPIDAVDAAYWSALQQI